ncbi:MAG TPA: hypothetical protein VFG69_00810 [Nannocystaceae bacterium]|nr:hypothetical protein [Nannocystaceae bacterium]
MSARVAGPATTTTAPEPTDPTAPAPAEPAPSGWDDEPITDPPAPAPAPAPAVEQTPPPGMQETHEVTRPLTHPGIGLMVGAGVAGLAGWGLMAGKMGLVNRCSDDIDSTMTTGDAEVTAYSCFTSAKAILGLSVAGWFVNWATWGLAAGAGAVRGKHDGVGYAWDGTPDRKSVGFIAGGAATMGIGLLGVGLTRVFALTNILRCPIDTEVDHCVKRRLNGYFAGVQISSALVATGLGLMIYGIVYRKSRRQFEDKAPRVSHVQVVPDVSLFRGAGGAYSGLALTGRF